MASNTFIFISFCLNGSTRSYHGAMKKQTKCDTKVRNDQFDPCYFIFCDLLF
ncbi:hypothetical protein C2W63_02954 [Bacillus velezensis]|nr:hypothetical protein C2W63_02954 [Bacillus velezensis]